MRARFVRRGGLVEFVLVQVVGSHQVAHPGRAGEGGAASATPWTLDATLDQWRLFSVGS